jgi:GNAT superfamily N-acetyltransferase
MTVTFRPGTIDDNHATFLVFQHALLDLSQRIGAMAITNGNESVVLENLWEERRPLLDHLARTAENFWIAEKNGEIIGFARSILRDGTRELTEFFVLPGHQSDGVGRELLARTFPAEGAVRRSIVSTTDTRAVARYLKAGVYPRTPVYYFSRTAEEVDLKTELVSQPFSSTPEILDRLRAIDRAVVGYGRDADHEWLMETRQGFLYYRGGLPVGYGYVGAKNGPFALLKPNDFPAVLAHAESETARQSAGRNATFGIEVPLINRAAVDYLLGRRFEMDSFFTYLMSNEPFGAFDRYIFTSPPYFI